MDTKPDRSTGATRAWAVRFRRCRCARCCRKRGGRQIGDHLEKHFADFGISRPLSGLSALLGMAQILGGFRTHGAASVDVHSGNLTHVGVAASLSPTLCLGSATLCKIGTLLVTFGGQCCISATAATSTCGVLYDFNEGATNPQPRLQRGYDVIGVSAPTMLMPCSLVPCSKN